MLTVQRKTPPKATSSPKITADESWGEEFTVKMFVLLTILQVVHLKLAKSIKAWETFVRAMSRASVTD